MMTRPLHADCLRSPLMSDPVADDRLRPAYRLFRVAYRLPVEAAIARLQDPRPDWPDLQAYDEGSDLVGFIFAQPNPECRYDALVGVIVNLLEALTPRRTDDAAPTPAEQGGAA